MTSEFTLSGSGLIFIQARVTGDNLEADSSTASPPPPRAIASKKHFFRRTKIPYPDKSRLFDRGFPGRAVYFTYKVTRWITRALFFAWLPGITFLNGFYVLNSNGARFARMPLRTHAPRATPPAGTLRTISVPHPLVSPSASSLPPLPPPSPPPSPPPDTLLRPSPRRFRHPRSVSAGRFFAVGTISLCQTGAGLICEAFAGTSRPRIIIKIPHRHPPPLPPAPPLPSPLLPLPPRGLPPSFAAARRRSPSVILHSIPSWINPLMAGSLICAPLQNNRENCAGERGVEAWPVEKFIIHKVLLLDRFLRYRALSPTLEKNEY